MEQYRTRYCDCWVSMTMIMDGHDGSVDNKEDQGSSTSEEKECNRSKSNGKTNGKTKVNYEACEHRSTSVIKSVV